MKYTVANHSARDQAFRAVDGLQIVARKQTATVEMADPFTPLQIVAFSARGIGITQTTGPMQFRDKPAAKPKRGRKKKG